MWTAPARKGLETDFFDRIACVHMSGLFDAVAHDRWPRWVPRRELHTGTRRRAPLDSTECLASWIDRSLHLLLLLQVSASVGRAALKGAVRPANFVQAACAAAGAARLAS